MNNTLKELREKAHAELSYCCGNVMDMPPVKAYITALEQMLFGEIATKVDRCEFTRDWVQELGDE